MAKLCATLCTQLSGERAVPLSLREGVRAALAAFEDDGGMAAAEHFLPGRYSRNLVAEVPGLFSLILLCWPPGVRSPIHDHARASCFMRVLEGELVEQIFDAADNSLVPGRVSRVRAGEVVFIDDGVGLHSVNNESPTVRSRSLHLYSPPFATCRVWLAPGWPLDAALEPTVVYHSRFGTVESCGALDETTDESAEEIHPT